VDRKHRKRIPAPPFLPDLAAGMPAAIGAFMRKRHALRAQSCTKCRLGDGQVGLITYMRTDSLTLSQEAVGQIRDVIVQRYGAAGLAEEPRVFRTKSTNARKCARAIRPTARIVSCPATSKGNSSRISTACIPLSGMHRRLPDGAGDLRHRLRWKYARRPGAEPNRAARENGSTLVTRATFPVYQAGMDDSVQDALTMYCRR